MEIAEVLAHRRSVRAFSQKAIDDDDLDALFEAARWAPSNGNRQPWRFIALKSAEKRAAMAGVLSRGNQWALAAPVLVIGVARFSDSGYSNGIQYAPFDCGLAVMSLIVEAESLGLRVHPMAGWVREPLVEIIGLPPDVDPLVVLAIGYEGDPETLPPELQVKERRPRVRKSLEDVRVADRWNENWNDPVTPVR